MNENTIEYPLVEGIGSSRKPQPCDVTNYMYCSMAIQAVAPNAHVATLNERA